VFVQANVAWNARKGTLRGMHYQRAPHEEAKLVRCTRGAIFDVAIDLRPGSRTFKKWVGFELSEENRLIQYVPRGCAHGYLTLRDDTSVCYEVSQAYAPSHAAGVRWDDPAFSIRWPIAPTCLAPRDAGYEDFDPRPAKRGR
jgi:dTDP-4-dehydrorhamnose 3,5-epimerase